MPDENEYIKKYLERIEKATTEEKSNILNKVYEDGFEDGAKSEVEEKKVCKCGLAAFGYADTTDRLKFFLEEARKSESSKSFAAFVGEQLQGYLQDMDKFCGLKTDEAIKKVDMIRTLLKEKKEEPLDFKNFLLAESLFNDLDHLIVPDLKKCAENPSREYLPYGLTEEEKASPELREKISRCIQDVEKKSCPESALKPDGKYDYELCSANPVAVCRASIEK